jgi:hypothetical protein
VEQSLGTGWHAVIHPEDLKRVLGEWEAALAGGKPMYYEARYRQRIERRDATVNMTLCFIAYSPYWICVCLIALLPLWHIDSRVVEL